MPNLNAINLKTKEKIAVACSGGIDSMCLAHILSQEHDIIALIIDHGLRIEAKTEAKKTQEILNNLGIENIILEGNKTIDSNIQAEARKLRYDLLISYCKEHNIKTLAIAQHADDNAETVLLKLSRGSGVDGLCGILPETEIDGIKIIRPLLNYRKSELKKYLVEQNIEWVQDPTNQTDKYKRNKLRHLLEEIEEPYLVISRLNDTAENMRRVRDFLEQETYKAFIECIKNNEIELAKFKTLHEEIAYRLLVKIIMEKSNLEQRPRFEKIKGLYEAILAEDVKTLGGLIFRPKKDKILIELENKA